MTAPQTSWLHGSKPIQKSTACKLNLISSLISVLISVVLVSLIPTPEKTIEPNVPDNIIFIERAFLNPKPGFF